MDVSLVTMILLPAGLGLLGFIEPCTIGGHLVFLDTQKTRTRFERIKALSVFVAARAIVAGAFGAFVAFLGQRLIGLQTGMWLVFGLVYLFVGLAFVLGRAGFIKHRINIAPDSWKKARNPVVLGLAFGLNIPACSAPILFGLLGLAATTGTIFTGFMMMFLFGLFLSMPLVVFAAIPSLGDWLGDIAIKLRNSTWIIGTIFLLLGLWSIWFGLFVDPANWVGRITLN